MAKKIAKAFILAVILILLNASPTSAQANQPVVVVTGEADARVTPDTATINLGSETEAKTAREALKKSSDTTDKIINKLVALKIPRKKIKTAGYTLFFDRERDVFAATSIIEFPVDDVDQVGTVLDKAVSAGANIVESVFYSVKDPEPIKEKLLAKAVKKSRSKAKALAKAGGFKIDGIKKIDETEVLGPVIAGEGGAEAPTTPSPTVPGELKIAASVRVTYSMK